LPLSTSEFSITICEGESYSFQGEEYTEPGIYSSVFVGTNLCDSIVLLNLTVTPSSTQLIQLFKCENESIFVEGQEIEQSEEYTFTFQNQTGCDSILVYSIQDVPAALTTIDTTLCFGENFTWNDQTISESGVYTVTLQNSVGCDS